MIFVISLIFTVVFILTLRPHAGRFGLLDYPGDHKVHSEPTPMIGGPAIFVGVTVALFLAAPSDVALKLFMDMSPLLLLGLVDDIWKLRPMSRLIIQVAVVTQMMIVHNTAFVQLGFLVGSNHLVYLNQLSIPFTIFALVAQRANRCWWPPRSMASCVPVFQQMRARFGGQHGVNCPNKLSAYETFMRV